MRMNRYEALRILGLGSEATLEDARRAYREQVKLWHPDRYSENSALKAMALRNVQDANRAWAYLRSRLPRALRPLKESVAKAPTAKSVERRSPLTTPPPPKSILEDVLHQGILKLAPLIARIRHLQFDGITGWLRDNPNRHYRPWYRYSREDGRDSKYGRRPTFGQTLAEVMRKRTRGALKATPANRQIHRDRASVAPSAVSKTDQQDGEVIGAIEPVKPSRKS